MAVYSVGKEVFTGSKAKMLKILGKYSVFSIKLDFPL